MRNRLSLMTTLEHKALCFALGKTLLIFIALPSLVVIGIKVIKLLLPLGFLITKFLIGITPMFMVVALVGVLFVVRVRSIYNDKYTRLCAERIRELLEKESSQRKR